VLIVSSSIPKAGPVARLLRPITIAITHRQLILRVVRREVEQRYRGSMLGILWTLLTPLIMLAVYSFVFSTVFPSPWAGESTTTPMPLLLFAGLILFGVMADTVNRAPSLILENANYVKKVVFPLETLAWVALLANLVQAGISLLVWLLIHCLWVGVPPSTLLLLPLALVPLCLMTLGITWALAALGLFLRDLRQIVPVATTALMFLSPIFFPRSKIPKDHAWLVDLNPLTWTLEACRGLMIYGRLPEFGSWAVLTMLGYVVARVGLSVFQRLRAAFSDVL
jgi:lipopolysaccharide transport system permease protein